MGQTLHKRLIATCGSWRCYRSAYSYNLTHKNPRQMFNNELVWYMHEWMCVYMRDAAGPVEQRLLGRNTADGSTKKGHS